MAHEIDFSNAQANIAVIHESEADTPWHGLGQRMQQGMSKAQWAQAAGLAHSVKSAPVQFIADNGSHHVYSDKVVLYRSDTLKALSVVGDGYKIVQPGEVLDFFEGLAKHNKFTLETAGSLAGGRRIWALAKVHDGEAVIGEDVVKPYVLLATSYDGTLATTARFTTVRVVCQNTLSMADNESGKVVRVPHSAKFDATEARLDLGIAHDTFERFLVQSRQLAKRNVNEKFAVSFLKEILPPAFTIETVNGKRVSKPAPVEEGRGFQQIMALFKGEAIGSDLKGSGGTAWGLLNSVTQYVDWMSGRSNATRMNSAWFGQGESLKTKARDLLTEVICT